MFTCDYCEKKLSTKYALQRHQNGCNQHHLQNQQEYYERELQNLREQYERELQTQREHHQRELQVAREQLDEFKAQIFEIAKQPKQVNHNHMKTTNNNQNQKNLNLIQQLAPMDFNQDPTKLTEIFKQGFTEDVFFEGPAGITRLVVENMLVDQESGKFRMICSDSSRKNFKYTDEESGELKTDHGMTRLHDMVKKPLSDANMMVYLESTKNAGDHTRDRFRNLRERNDGFIMNRYQMSDKIISEITK